MNWDSQRATLLVKEDIRKEEPFPEKKDIPRYLSVFAWTLCGEKGMSHLRTSRKSSALIQDRGSNVQCMILDSQVKKLSLKVFLD